MSDSPQPDRVEESLLPLEPSEDTEIIIPSSSSDSEQPPVSAPIASQRTVAQELGELFVGEDDDEEDSIPGEGDSRPPPAPVPDLDATEIAEALRANAKEQASASAKSRSLAVASLVLNHLGRDEEAIDCARQGAEASPKLTVGSLLLRKFALDSDPESTIRSLDANTRLAQHPASRTHSRKVLARLLRRQGDKAGTMKVLDQAARSGEADLALILERIVAKLETGQSMAGVYVPPFLEAEVSATQEVLSGEAPREAKDLCTSLDDDLLVIRAARELDDGNGVTALDLLELWHTRAAQKAKSTNSEDSSEASEHPSPQEDPNSPLHSTALLELRMSLNGAVHETSAADETDASPAAAGLSQSPPLGDSHELNGEAKDSVTITRPTHPGKVSLQSDKGLSRRVLRNWAARCVEAADWETLRRIVGASDPGSGTFTLDERVFFAACSGDSFPLSPSELEALHNEKPGLATALSPLRSPTASSQEATRAQLLVQLGASLGGTSQPETNSSALDALTALEEMGRDLALCASVRLALATKLLASEVSDAGSRSEAQVSIAQSLLVLGSESKSADLLLMAGARLQLCSLDDQAELAYKSALELNPNLADAVSRGLIELGAPDARDSLSRFANETGEESLRFAAELEMALAEDGDEIASAAVAACIKLVQSRPGAKAEDASPDENRYSDALLFAASAISATVGKEDDAEQARELLLAQNSEFAALTRIRSLAFTPSKLDSDNPDRFTRDDVTLHGLRAWQDPALGAQAIAENRVLHRSDTEEDDAEEHDVESTAEMLSATIGAIAVSEPEIARAILKELPSSTSKSREEVLPELVELTQDLTELLGHHKDLAPFWLGQAKSASDDPDAKRYAYERLASLDEQAGDRSSAALWQKTLIEEFPQHRSSLLRLEEAALRDGKPFDSYAESLAEQLPPGDREPYQLVAGAVALADSDLRSARKHLEPLLSLAPPPLLAVRGLATVAREKRDDILLARCIEALAKGTGTDLDRAATGLEGAQLSCRLDQEQDAREKLAEILKVQPQVFAAQQLLHHLAPGDGPIEKAERLEEFARASSSPEHQAELWFSSGEAWDLAEDPGRAVISYEQTLAADPSNKKAFYRLLELHSSTDDSQRVQQLIERRLPLISESGQEHLSLELRLAELLAKQDQAEEAKAHLEHVLSLHPENSDALRAHAEVSAQLGAHESAEGSLVALRDRLSDSPERVAVIRSLARLYDEHLGLLEKSMDAYQEVLKAAPDDDTARVALIEVYSRLGLPERATQLQTERIQKATSVEQKRSGALKLAEIYEKVAGDAKRAAATLERTRKAWPLDADVLEATILFMDRQGSGGPRGFLLDRADKDARRKLEDGRLDASLLDTLSRVARLSGRPAMADGALAARVAYLGTEEEPLAGAGVHALSHKLDESIAPRILGAPLRNLLRKTGPAMDAAFSVDLGNMGATPCQKGELYDRVQKIAAALSIGAPQLFMSESLGARCIPVSSAPPRLLVGSRVAGLPGRERDYLLLRGFKLLTMGVGALARSRDEDRWPMLVALLHLFSPNWRPASVDGRKAAQAKAAIEQGLARVGYDDDVPVLALEVIGGIGSRTGGLGDASRILANRAALLAVGDLKSVLSAIASGEGASLPSGGPSRFRWIEAHAEAKDLMLFCTGEKHADAREQLGLAEKSSTPKPVAQPGAAHSRGPNPPRAATSPRAPGSPVAPPRRAAPMAPPRRGKPPPPKR